MFFKHLKSRNIFLIISIHLDKASQNLKQELFSFFPTYCFFTCWKKCPFFALHLITFLFPTSLTFYVGPSRHTCSMGHFFWTFQYNVMKFSHIVHNFICYRCRYRVFIKYCVFSKILIYFPDSVFSRCTNTRQVEHQRCSRTGRVLKNHKVLRKKHNI